MIFWLSESEVGTGWGAEVPQGGFRLLDVDRRVVRRLIDGL